MIRRQARHTAADLIRAVETFSHPITTMEVAASLRETPAHVASRLSKLADQGMIGREHRAELRDDGVFHKYCVWSGRSPGTATLKAIAAQGE